MSVEDLDAMYKVFNCLVAKVEVDGRSLQSFDDLNKTLENDCLVLKDFLAEPKSVKGLAAFDEQALYSSINKIMVKELLINTGAQPVQISEESEALASSIGMNFKRTDLSVENLDAMHKVFNCLVANAEVDERNFQSFDDLSKTLKNDCLELKKFLADPAFVVRLAAFMDTSKTQLGILIQSRDEPEKSAYP